MTKSAKTGSKSGQVIKSTTTCKVLQKIESYSLAELQEKSKAKKLKIQLKKKLKRESARAKKAELLALTNVDANNEQPAKKRRAPEPKITVEKIAFLTSDHDYDKSASPSLTYIYSAQDLKALYNTKKAPQIPAQNKSGGQCGFQAMVNLLWSIPSVVALGEDSKFHQVDRIRDMMVATVKQVLLEFEEGKRACDNLSSRHKWPGDVKLKQFSVSAFLALGGRLFPYRFKEMRMKNGCNCGINWLLRQAAGYFIVYGNRHSEEDEKLKKYRESFHYLAVNIEKKLVIDNKSQGAFLRLCRESFDQRMKTVHTILKLEKMDEGIWRVTF